MNNLKRLREEAGLTQKELAEKMNVAKATIYFYEQGKISPSTEMLINLADFFGCSVDYLLAHRFDETETQQNLIAIIRTLDDDLCSLAEAYIEGLKTTQKQRDMVRARVSQQNNNIEEDID